MPRDIRKNRRASSVPAIAPLAQLGTVVRFNLQARHAGVRHLAAGGFRIASSADFSRAAAVPHDFAGADVQYFERFGIAIVRRDGERLRPTLQKAMEQNVVAAVRPERNYRALGMRALPTVPFAAGVASSVPDLGDYLRGYRDAVNHLVDQVTVGGTAPASLAAIVADETTLTWGLQAVGLPRTTLSGRGIRVAILDTGLDDTHPDFAGRSITKKLFASNSSDRDTVGHGTHCTGTACGAQHPATGPRYGIAYEAEIHAGKVLGDDGRGTDRSIIAGMDWALEQGCQLISMSLGAETEIGDQPSADYEQIGQACLDAGCLVIAAAGNESHRPGRIAPVGSPANASTIMAVAAVDRAFAVAPFSCGGMNHGQDVDIAAPGVDILSCLPGDRHDRWNGTSMATPHVTGVAALIAQSDPKFRGWALWTRVMQLARRLDVPARDVGRGLVQAP